MKLLDDDFIKRLEMLSVVSRKLVIGRIAGEQRSRRRGISSEFAEHRDYAAGDDTRFIDWNIYGRLNRLFLKLFHEEEDLHVSILLDASASMAYSQPDAADTDKFLFARRVAAALGYIAAIRSDCVSITAFSGEGSQVLPPFRGRKQVWRMFDFLEALEPEGSTSLKAACTSQQLRHRGRGIVLIISDFLDESGYEEALRRVGGRYQDVFALHILTRDELQPRLTGDLKLLDVESGAETEVSISSGVLKTYRNTVRSFCSGLQTFCGTRGIGYIFAPTDTPFEQLVLSYFRRIGLVK